MEHLRNRSDLVRMILWHSPSRAISRAIREGHIVNRGGFSVIPPFVRPGWICRVRSRHGRTWLLALLVNDIKHTYECHVINEIPWSKWVGKKGGGSIHDGDRQEGQNE